MRKKIILTLLIGVLLSQGLIFSIDHNAYKKGIVFHLLGDQQKAQRNFNQFFRDSSQPMLQGGYRFLVSGEYEEATKQFRNYLNLTRLSTHGIVGIALSTSTMEVSNSVELLQRAIKLESGFSPAYLSMGYEYMKRKNFPQAEAYYMRAIRLSPNTPEYKILLGQLYLDYNQPGNALKYLQREADRMPDSFYFNFLTAKAFLQLNQTGKLGPYIQAAMDVNPTNNEAKLLTARYHLSRNDLPQVKIILKGLKFSEYNEEFSKTQAELLVRLKDKKARKYLYQVLDKKPWDPDINRLLGMYYAQQGATGPKVQNWIYRSILCGLTTERLKELFPGNYHFPQHLFFPFFEVKEVIWASENTAIAFGRRRSGERESIYVMDLEKKRIVQSLPYRGKFQSLFQSKNRTNFAFSSSADDEKSVYLYALSPIRNQYRLASMYPTPIKSASVLGGFNSTGTLVYITDSQIEKIAFESPFSQTSHISQKKPVYHIYPFYIYQYNFVTRKFHRVNEKDTGSLSIVPIDAVKKYVTISNAALNYEKIQNLIEKGEQLDITSTEVVKIHCSSDNESFIIYLSDIKNAFKGYVYNGDRNKIRPIDETMFLGKDGYAELTIVDFEPRRNEILALTKKNSELYFYNYRNHLHLWLAENVNKVHVAPKDRMLYLLSKNKGKTLIPGSSLQVVSFNPYFSKMLNLRKGFEDVVEYIDESEIYLSTFEGEILKMNENYRVKYIGPSLTGCVYDRSPSGKHTAAFVNRGIFIIEEPPKKLTLEPEVEKKPKKK